MESTSTGTAWRQTACILCSVNCGIEVRPRAVASRASAAIEPIPARRATPARRRSGSTTTRTAAIGCTSPLRRRADGTFEAIDWDTAIARGRRRSWPRSATPTAARRSSITAAAGRGITSAARTRRHARGARLDLHLERARAGEDGRVLGRRPALRPAALPHQPATSSTPRWRCSSARTRGSRTASRARGRSSREIAGDPGACARRHRSAPHRDRRAGRHPSPGASGHRRLLPERAARRARAGGSRRSRLPRASARATATTLLDALRAVPIADYCARAGVAETELRAVGTPDRGAPRASRSSRTSASSRRRTARSTPTWRSSSTC